MQLNFLFANNTHNKDWSLHETKHLYFTRIKIKCEVPNTEDSLHNEHKMNHQRTQYYQPITMLQDNILLQSIIRQ